MTIPSSRSLIFEVKSTGSELEFIRVLRLGLNNFAFGRLRTSSEFFGNLRKWSCRLQTSQHSQDKNLTLISQKKLAGVHVWCDRSLEVVGFRAELTFGAFTYVKVCMQLQKLQFFVCLLTIFCAMSHLKSPRTTGNEAVSLSHCLV